MVGVKLPDSGVAGADETVGEIVVVGDGLTVTVGVGELLALGVAVGVFVGVADGVETNAGPSEAWTTNVLTKLLRIPLASLQETVILCVPSLSPSGGLHFQSPEEGTLTSSVTGSDSTVIVKVIPAGASPKNSGSVLVTTSPLSWLVRVTDPAGAGLPPVPETSKPEMSSFSGGVPMDDEGISELWLTGLFLKSYEFPSTIVGTGFADLG